MANYSWATLPDADFANKDLRNACFACAYLHKADFSGADCTNADFSGADLRGANFEDALLTNANFQDVDLRDVIGRDLSKLEYCITITRTVIESEHFYIRANTATEARAIAQKQISKEWNLLLCGSEEWEIDDISET